MKIIKTMIEFKHELLDDRVVLQPFNKENKTEDGLFIPPSAQKVSPFGTVVAVGKGTVAPDTGVKIEMFVKKGDIVNFNIGQCEPMEGFDGLLLMHQSAIRFIVKK